MLPESARREYDRMHAKLVAETEDGEVVAANGAVATGKLAQIANGFIYGGEGIMVGATATLVHDEKREWLADIIDNATGPTLLIYEFVEDLKLMRELIPELRVVGSHVNDASNIACIANWNAGRLPFMALHPAAGGHGLNLQGGGADMAWIAPTWSPELWEQTIARIHRSGQTKPVMVRVCVATGTVDEMKLQRVRYKMTAQAAFEKYLADYRHRMEVR